jgi:hypothetical protein
VAYDIRVVSQPTKILLVVLVICLAASVWNSVVLPIEPSRPSRGVAEIVGGSDVILGALVGGGSAADAAYLADRRRFKREDRYRDHSERRQAYVEFLSSWHSYEEVRTRLPSTRDPLGTHAELEEAVLQFQRSFNVLSLIAPDEVHAAAVSVREGRKGRPAAFGRQRERTSVFPTELYSPNVVEGSCIAPPR